MVVEVSHSVASLLMGGAESAAYLTPPAHSTCGDEETAERKMLLNNLDDEPASEGNSSICSEDNKENPPKSALRLDLEQASRLSPESSVGGMSPSFLDSSNLTVACAVAADKVKAKVIASAIEKCVAENGYNLYPSREVKEHIAKVLGVSFVNVNRWFANRRRKNSKAAGRARRMGTTPSEASEAPEEEVPISTPLPASSSVLLTPTTPRGIPSVEEMIANESAGGGGPIRKPKARRPVVDPMAVPAVDDMVAQRPAAFFPAAPATDPLSENAQILGALLTVLSGQSSPMQVASIALSALAHSTPGSQNYDLIMNLVTREPALKEHLIQQVLKMQIEQMIAANNANPVKMARDQPAPMATPPMSKTEPMSPLEVDVTTEDTAPIDILEFEMELDVGEAEEQRGSRSSSCGRSSPFFEAAQNKTMDEVAVLLGCKPRDIDIESQRVAGYLIEFSRGQL